MFLKVSIFLQYHASNTEKQVEFRVEYKVGGGGRGRRRRKEKRKIWRNMKTIFYEEGGGNV